jgi:hypothetical protein
VAENGLEWLQQITESGTQIRLARGVVGKGAVMWIAVIVVWGIALVRLSPTELLYDAALLAGAGFLTLLVRRETQRMREYAEKNPSTALLEGAELLAYKRFEAQAKELPAGDKSKPTSPTGEGLATVGPDEPQV